MIFFKTTSGSRFGGYTTQFWIESGGFIKDDKSFLFSLDLKGKYKVNDKDYALYCDKHFFQFGGCCFKICNNCTSVNTNYLNNGNRFYYIPDNFGLTGGDKNFIISSYEVYQIEF